MLTPEPIAEPTAEPCTKRRLMFACSDSYNPARADAKRWPHWIGEPERIGYGAGLIDGALVGRAEHGLVVAFRGTVPPFFEDDYDSAQVIRDWENDLDCPCMPVEGYAGRVHQGFAESMDKLWPDVSKAVTRIAEAQPGERLFVTGHSKGAALANLFAWRIRTLLPSTTRMKVVTFAGPRPGDSAFARAYRDAGIESVRYEAQFDLVPQVPFSAKAAPWVLPVMQRIAPHLLVLPNLTSFDYAPVGKPVRAGPGWLESVVAVIKSWLPFLPKDKLHPALPIDIGQLTRHIVAAHAIGAGSDYDAYVCHGEAACGPLHAI